MFEQEEQRDELLEKIEDLISRKRYAELRDLLLPLEAQDIAGLFMELDDKVPMVFRLLPKEQAAEVFVELDSEEQEVLIQSFSNTELKEVLDELYLDDAVDIVEEMPANVVKRILRHADPDVRKSINEILKYPDDCAGSIMTTEYVDLKATMTVEDALKRIRRTGPDKETINICYVIDEGRHLLGYLSIRTILLSEEDDVVGDICGIVSGTTTAVIVVRLQTAFALPESVLLSVAVTALVSGLTIGGKALGKTVALNKSTSVVYWVGRFLHLFHR